ncbi:RNA and export factor-binding 2 [Fusarium subglutinans]|uniref:RNA and export factor-binding 2 n=1 Tax=Gibberella subglutinans TaxID=42677 RepID=A0A8H5L7T0_GIBSU|nr:RNA and export factor-binding 2 [Fusarium subglutinans]KAF5587955.1 RNA and export factor-binding 2 [Fusarium subglutinans]
MADKMDRGLDEIIADTRANRPRNHRGQGRRREPRNDYPRDGVRKVGFSSDGNSAFFSVRDDSRNLDSEWVHDRFEENNNRRAPAPRRRRESPDQESKGAKLRVDNIHYDLTEEDLDELFRRIGPIVRLQLRYDRAGRSEGTAYVTYELKEDAQEAVKQFDGANANGQPIRLTLLPSRNPFDTAVMPGRPLAERISSPGERRSHSPHRRYDDDDAARRGIDRYVPGQGPRRSPMPRQGGRGRGQGGRRPGARRDGRDGRDGSRDQEGGRGGRGNPRGKKTQEELDAEMADYFGGGDNAQATEPAHQQNAPTAQTQAPAQTQAQAATDDVDMIE